MSSSFDNAKEVLITMLNKYNGTPSDEIIDKFAKASANAVVTMNKIIQDQQNKESEERMKHM